MALIMGDIVDGQYVDNNTYSQTTTSYTSGGDLGYEQFLQLLCAEMQYQDPLEPATNTEYIAQLATFSQLEAMLSLENTVTDTQASDLVGKYVIIQGTSATGAAISDAGYVDYVEYSGDTPTVYVNGNPYSMDYVYQVVDVDYMEAQAIASTLESLINALPNANMLTVDDYDSVNSVYQVYTSCSSYQLQFLSSDALDRFEEIVTRMNELTAAADSAAEEEESEEVEGEEDVDNEAAEEVAGDASAEESAGTDETDTDTSVEAEESGAVEPEEGGD